MSGQHTLPDLPYAYDALEPFISRQIMELHHKKYHQTYVNALNAAYAKTSTPKERIALQAALKFNGGGECSVQCAAGDGERDRRARRRRGWERGRPYLVEGLRQRSRSRPVCAADSDGVEHDTSPASEHTSRREPALLRPPHRPYRILI